MNKKNENFKEINFPLLKILYSSIIKYYIFQLKMKRKNLAHLEFAYASLRPVSLSFVIMYFKKNEKNANKEFVQKVYSIHKTKTHFYTN